MGTSWGVVREYKVWLMVSLLFSLILVGMAIFGEKGFLEVYTLEHELQAVKTRFQALQKENQALRAEIHALIHSPYFIEKIAREELGLARPGEIIFEFVDPLIEER